MKLEVGLYEHIINKLISEYLEDSVNELEPNFSIIDNSESHQLLAQYLKIIFSQTLPRMKAIKISESSEKQKKNAQIQICNEIIEMLSNKLNDPTIKKLKIDEKGEILLSLYKKYEEEIVSSKSDKSLRIRPESPMGINSLFTGSSKDEPPLMNELRKEILTSDRIDFLVSFIKWSGLRQILKELEKFTQSHDKYDIHGIKQKKLRVITTTYMGATDLKAILRIAKLPNTEIKISYDTNRTRLHAKSYIFYRNTGFSTVYIGSSNLSKAAISSGLEWNVKVSAYDSKDIFDKCEGTFENYWNDKEFETFRLDRDLNKLKNSLNLSKMGINGINGKSLIDNAWMYKFNIQPYSFQQEILDKLKVEREIYNRWYNLVIAATGTGKTIISAFDYKRFKETNKKSNPTSKSRLLFIAHRKEILEQSIGCFRGVLRDENFGDLWVGEHQPLKEKIDHLFMSIQSFQSKKLTSKLRPDYFDYIIIDEFHHAAAKSYKNLLEYFKPKILLGLTATPERMDGKHEEIIKTYFNDGFAVEIRLSEAINRKLLCPFHYFMVTDPADLSSIKWERGGYRHGDLIDLYTKGKMSERRAETILNALSDYTTDINEIKGIGFCAGVEHAIYMADYFNMMHINSVALHAKTPILERKNAQTKLSNREITFIFVADLYNEGIDIPDINTVLFLRPTESLTIYLQQLGRGLRLSDDKECLTVLDFVANANKHYNFEKRLRVILGKTKKSIEKEVLEGFPNVPKGCFIQMEKVAQKYILDNVKYYINDLKGIKRKLKDFHLASELALTLSNFLNFYEIPIESIYKSAKAMNRGFNRLLESVEIIEDFQQDNPDEIQLVKGIKRLIRTNSKSFLEFIKNLTQNDEKTLREFVEGLDKGSKNVNSIKMLMFHYTFWDKSPKQCGFSDLSESFSIFLNNSVILQELKDVVDHLLSKIDIIEQPTNLGYICPLHIHSKYILDQILTGLEFYNFDKKPSFREGVKYLKDKNTDLLFITLNKSDKDYSPTTLYKDYSINNELFHWQSQSTTSEESNTGLRYFDTSKDEMQKVDGHKVLLFVRKYRKEKGMAAPFYFLGPASYVKHEGSRPINIIWNLETPMPEILVEDSNKFTLT